jgi:8-oxo-dGTP pyrophosphatase MutT (NUDIX family)
MKELVKSRFAGTLPPADPVAEAAARLRPLFPVDVWLAARPSRPAGVLVGLVDRPGEPGILLTRRTDSLADHAGQIAFPGGRIEAEDAGPAAAALRETAEETGIGPGFIEVVGYLPAHLTLTGFAVIPVVAVLRPDFLLRPDPKEVAEVFELPLEVLMDESRHEREWREVSGRRLELPVFHHQGRRIWGATAMMLADFHRCLKGTP